MSDDGRPTARQLAGDVALTAALLAISVSLTTSILRESGAGIVRPLVLATIHVAPLVVRRRYLLQAFPVMLVGGGLFVVGGYPTVALGPALLVAVYSAGAWLPRRQSLLVAGGSVAVQAVALLSTTVTPDTILGNAVVLTTVWVVGDANRRARERAAAERERAGELAATREELAQRAVVDERLRIARELHDVVAHSMSVVAVQAGTARMVVDESPEVAKESLAAIERTSREALAEMRRLLSVLRSDDTGVAVAPAPGVADLPALAESSAEGGLPVTLRVDGEPVVLPSGADLVVYRVVQESLTNVRKHAGASSAEVVLRYEPDAVVVQVRDDGSAGGGRVGTAGLGLTGMRERVALYGGSLEAGPSSTGRGFVVTARLPLAEAS